MRLPGAPRARAVVMGLVLTLAAAGCGGGSGAPAGGGGNPQSAAPIVIGASIPVTGTFAAFGSYIKWGYQHAVDQVNAQGGIAIGGQKRKVQLTLLDDQSNPDDTANNVRRLILQDHVAGLLTSCTPPLVNAGALVADANHVPMVGGCDPIASFEAAHKWTYVWDVFFFDPNLAATPFEMMKSLNVVTNRKVAIIYDNSPDGLVVGGTLWPKLAQQYGYTVAYKASFPLGTTSFANIVNSVKASGADIVFVDTDTPTGIAIRQQMQQLGVTPKILDVEKGAEPEQFAKALGKLSDGVLVGGYWSPNSPYPGAKELAQAYQQETHQTWSQHIADSYTAAQILLQAIAKAGSLDAAKINAAIAQTDGTYVVGPVAFNHKDLPHAAPLPLTEDQWQNGQIDVVWPSDRATGKLLFPIPGATQ